MRSGGGGADSQNFSKFDIGIRYLLIVLPATLEQYSQARYLRGMKKAVVEGMRLIIDLKIASIAYMVYNLSKREGA